MSSQTFNSTLSSKTVILYFSLYLYQMHHIKYVRFFFLLHEQNHYWQSCSGLKLDHI